MQQPLKASIAKAGTLSRLKSTLGAHDSDCAWSRNGHQSKGKYAHVEAMLQEPEQCWLHSYKAPGTRACQVSEQRSQGAAEAILGFSLRSYFVRTTKDALTFVAGWHPSRMCQWVA